jgi:hypothetical protein
VCGNKYHNASLAVAKPSHAEQGVHVPFDVLEDVQTDHRVEARGCHIAVRTLLQTARHERDIQMVRKPPADLTERLLVRLNPHYTWLIEQELSDVSGSTPDLTHAPVYIGPDLGEDPVVVVVQLMQNLQGRADLCLDPGADKGSICQRNR